MKRTASPAGTDSRALLIVGGLLMALSTVLVIEIDMARLLLSPDSPSASLQVGWLWDVDDPLEAPSSVGPFGLGLRLLLGVAALVLVLLPRRPALWHALGTLAAAIALLAPGALTVSFGGMPGLTALAPSKAAVSAEGLMVLASIACAIGVGVGRRGRALSFGGWTLLFVGVGTGALVRALPAVQLDAQASGWFANHAAVRVLSHIPQHAEKAPAALLLLPILGLVLITPLTWLWRDARWIRRGTGLLAWLVVLGVPILTWVGANALPILERTGLLALIWLGLIGSAAVFAGVLLAWARDPRALVDAPPSTIP